MCNPCTQALALTLTSLAISGIALLIQLGADRCRNCCTLSARRSRSSGGGGGGGGGGGVGAGGDGDGDGDVDGGDGDGDGDGADDGGGGDTDDGVGGSGHDRTMCTGSSATIITLALYAVVTCLEFALFVFWIVETNDILSDKHNAQTSTSVGFRIIVAAACLHLSLCILEGLRYLQIRRHAHRDFDLIQSHIALSLPSNLD